MLEDYLSLQLKNIEEELLQAQLRIEENTTVLNDSALHAKQLHSQIDPSMEIFSPLKINENLKKDIRLANERIEQAKEDMEKDRSLIEELENNRISLVTMLSSFRQDKYKLQRYESCNITQLLTKLKETLQKAQNEVVSSELSDIHDECLHLINDCMSRLISRNKTGGSS